MKKRILILLTAALALLCLPTSAFAAKKTVYVISSITVKNTSGSTVDTIRYTYNKRGLVKKRVWSQPGGTSTEKFNYDSRNRLKTKTIYAGGRKNAKYTYRYEGDQLVSGKSVFYETGEEGTITYTCDEQGRLVNIHDSYDNSYNEIAYDAKNRIVKQDMGWRKMQFTYDKKGNVIKENWDGSAFRKYKNSYAGGSKRLKNVVVTYPNGRKICTDVIKYKKMKVDKTNVPAVKKQQVEWSMDPISEMFPM